MNTNGLTKHYEKLTPWERVPLMIDADARGDTLEFARLKHSAPKKAFLISHHGDLIDGLHVLADMQMIFQLELTAAYWQARATGAGRSRLFAIEQTGRKWDQFSGLERLLAHSFLVNTDAWERFCSELSIDPGALLRDCPGYDTISRMQEIARLVAYSADEAAAFTKQRDPDAQICTVEEGVKVLREFIHRVVHVEA